MSEAESVESEIQRKGLSGPRITPEHIESVIESESYHVFPNSTFTVCLLTLSNGFNVIGESACADPANFDAGLGRRIARENAVRKIWPLEGYLLRQTISEGSVTTASNVG